MHMIYAKRENINLLALGILNMVEYDQVYDEVEEEFDNVDELHFIDQ